MQNIIRDWCFGLALMAAAWCFGAPAFAEVTEATTDLGGGFSLIVEEARLGPNELPIMHVSQNWTKLHLRYDDTAQNVRLAVIDNGNWLEVKVTQANHPCTLVGNATGYPAEGQDASLWQEMGAVLGRYVSICPNMTAVRRRAIMDGWRAARPSFATALIEVRQRAARIFPQNPTRCARLTVEYTPVPTQVCADPNAPEASQQPVPPNATQMAAERALDAGQPEEARSIYREACRRGDDAACAAYVQTAGLALIMAQRGQLAEEGDSATTVLATLSQGCRQRSAAACNAEGLAYQPQGIAGTVDAQKAQTAFISGCSLGNDQACQELGSMVIRQEVHSAATQQILAILQRRCRQNSQEYACLNLGRIYEQGGGVAANRGEAVTWYAHALRVNPNNPFARDRLQALQGSDGG